MKKILRIYTLLICTISLCIPSATVYAATPTTAQLLSQIQFLKAQLQALEQQLLLQTNTASSPQCYTDTYGRRYCTVDTQSFSNRNNIDTIEVDFVGRIAQVRVQLDDGDSEYYAFDARTKDEVATLLASTLGRSYASILALIDTVSSFTRSSSNHTDIRSINVDFVGNDANVLVRFRDGDTDRFTFRNVDHSESTVISRLADRYDESRSAIRDLIDFSNRTTNNDIRNIDVTFSRDDADILVRFHNGGTERFTLRDVDDDEDEVISRLADRYDMSERDIEDVIDFD